MQERARLADLHAAAEAAKTQEEEAAAANADADRLAALHEAAEALKKQEEKIQLKVDIAVAAEDAVETMEGDERVILTARKAARKKAMKFEHVEETDNEQANHTAADSVAEAIRQMEEDWANNRAYILRWYATRGAANSSDEAATQSIEPTQEPPDEDKEDELSIALRAVEEAKQQEDKETSKLAQANAAAEVAKKTEQEEREKLSAAHAEVETLMNKEKEAIANKEGAESMTTIHKVVEAAMKTEEEARARLHAAEVAEEASANEARRQVIIEGMWHFEAAKAAAEAESERLASQSALTEELKKQEEEVT